MALYENTFIARPDMSGKEVEKLAETMGDIIKKNGGKVVKVENWGLRNLAYRVNKNRKGYYVMLGIDAPSAALKEMERNMRLSEDVMRNLSIKVDKISKEPSVMMQQDDSNDAGGSDERD